MSRSVSPGRGSQRAYTLIEMVAVTAILLLLSALIMPNLVAIERSRTLRNQVAALRQLPVQAKNLAIQQNTPMVLRTDGDSLVIEPDTEAVATSQAQNNGNRLPTADTAANDLSGVQKRVTLNSEIQIVTAQQEGNNVDSASWRWTVYPDGSSSDGGLEFRVGADTRALYLPASRPPQWIEGNLPDPTQERWDVGQLEQRVSQ